MPELGMGDNGLPEGWAMHLVMNDPGNIYFFWHEREPATEKDIKALVNAVRKPFHYGGPMSGASFPGWPDGDPPIHKRSLEGHGWHYKDDDDGGPTNPTFV